MQRFKTAIFIIIGILFVGMALYFFLPDRKLESLESVETTAFVKQEQVENKENKETENTAVKETTQKEEEEKETSITQEIKNKVREVVEGALDLFIKDQKIVSIGDSLTEGVGDESENGGYVGILNNTFEDHKLNITVENFGKKGNRSDQLLKRLEREEISTAIKDSNVVLITIGANDIMKVFRSNLLNVTMEPFEEEKVEYIKRLTAIFDKINSLNPDVQIYLIGFYNPFERHFSEIKELGMIIDDWNDAGMALTEEYENVSYIPTIDLFSQSTMDLLADDEFHPNTAGYKLMAQRVLEYLKDTDGEVVSNEADVAS